jgi:CysZ protein
MFKALSKGISQLNDRATRQVLLISIGLALAVFFLLWSAVAYTLTNTALFQMAWLETIIDVLGGLATGVLTWFLFPGVVSAVVSLFLERVADCVEAKHYPGLPKTDGQPMSDALISSIRFLAIFITLNLLMLPFLFFPPIFPFVFYGVNGYLLSREYFELVALRRLEPAEARALRKANQGRLFVAGVGIALLLTIPVINLITPVVATATIIHLFEGWRSKATTQLATR